MRELKFRAWDEIHKRIRPVIAFGFLSGEVILKGDFKFPIYQIPIMQFTGLYDSTKWEELTEAERESWVMSGNMPSDWKGKEIFECDIVKAEHENYHDDYEKEPEYFPYVGEVEYNIGWQIKNINSNYKPALTNIRIVSIKVIGNIFENSDLLEVK